MAKYIVASSNAFHVNEMVNRVNNKYYCGLTLVSDFSQSFNNAVGNTLAVQAISIPLNCRKIKMKTISVNPSVGYYLEDQVHAGEYAMLGFDKQVIQTNNVCLLAYTDYPVTTAELFSGGALVNPTFTQRFPTQYRIAQEWGGSYPFNLDIHDEIEFSNNVNYLTFYMASYTLNVATDITNQVPVLTETLGVDSTKWLIGNMYVHTNFIFSYEKE